MGYNHGAFPIWVSSSGNRLITLKVREGGRSIQKCPEVSRSMLLKAKSLLLKVDVIQSFPEVAVSDLEVDRFSKASGK